MALENHMKPSDGMGAAGSQASRYGTRWEVKTACKKRRRKNAKSEIKRQLEE